MVFYRALYVSRGEYYLIKYLKYTTIIFNLIDFNFANIVLNYLVKVQRSHVRDILNLAIVFSNLIIQLQVR